MACTYRCTCHPVKRQLCVRLSSTCTYFCTIYQQYIRIVLDRLIQQYICMVITYIKSMDQPGKVANPARGQLNRENEYFPVCVRA